MKRLFTLLFCAILVSNISSVQAQSYCSASATCSGTYEYISTVIFNTINNNSGACGTSGYTDFTNINTIVAPGGSYEIIVLPGNVWAYDECAVYVDWNHDYDFGDGYQ